MRNDTRASVAGVGGFALLAAAIATTAVLVGGTDPAGASQLARFSSCAELRGWVGDLQVEPSVGALEDLAEFGEESSDAGPAAGAAPTLAAGSPTARSEATTGEGQGGDDAGTGGTNTVVEGVDEIDIVDRLPGDRLLVARNGTLSLVALDGLRLIATVRGLPADARVSVGGDVVWVAGSALDGTGVVVERLRLGETSLAREGTWRTPGGLIDARRTGDRLHVLAVDHPRQPGTLPFEGGPVPCDQVWRPEAGADTAAATMLATLPADGDLAPTATAQVVGAGAGFLVTDTAAYVTTQTWQASVQTAVHRFDLATLAPTGSGSVPGAVPGPFGIDEHEGHLRVATSAQPELRGGPVLEGDVAVERSMPAPTTEGAGPLAEVFVLDLDGALDVVGRTGRFGHDGETIHGVRFVGDVGYVVTFLQTDPFWILDLTDPASPRTVGELEIPGFSGYLHPLDGSRVVGFGPDGEGRVAARLFDVSDPAAPSVVDELVLGDDSPVVWDHHAYVTLDDARFAVPVNEQPTFLGERCGNGPAPLPGPEPLPIDPGFGVGSEAPLVAPCEPILDGGRTGVAVLAVRAGRLAVVDERSVPTDGSFTAERVVPAAGDRWILVGWDRLVDPAGGEIVLPAG